MSLLFALQVTVNNEDSDESFDSSWSYMQHIQSNALFGHDRRTFHKDVTESKVMEVLGTGSDWFPFTSLQGMTSKSCRIYHPGLQIYHPEE